MRSAVYVHSIADMHNSTHLWQGPTVIQLQVNFDASQNTRKSISLIGR